MVEIIASDWLNTPNPLSLAALRGKVVALEAFQMLCPGCVSHGLPQAQSIRRIFPEEDVAVIGLHSVFEHHAAMTPVALRAFLHEYRITFPVAIDSPGESGPLPRTMEALGLRGTPSLLLFDRAGELRAHHFGQVHDMVIGAEIAALLAEPPA
ncbi:redoxin domain-containing protein [Frigidibacter sp. RF13]|uniref:redoxin family protein n=1 Tax=Frigidibacter sp. RF13 TaxID=2997340 RepID=UPI00226F9E33|nr:redoxin family protein [Frigidibacter sp. RF13]MCY1127563.1 redoxin domain-containing protein [Frigidibacter sp. RF13]